MTEQVQQEPKQPACAERLAALLAERRGEMVGYARKKLLERHIPPSRLEAEDVVQNACAKVLKNPHTIWEIRPYVYRVIDHEIDQAERKYHSYPAPVGGIGPGEEPASGGSGPGPVLASVALSVGLKSLSPQQYIAFLANKVAGYTQAETAQAMGVAPGTVATHVSRAMTALKWVLIFLPTVLLVILPLRHGGTAFTGETPPAHWGLTLVWQYTLVCGLLAAGIGLAKWQHLKRLGLATRRRFWNNVASSFGMWVGSFVWQLGSLLAALALG